MGTAAMAIGNKNTQTESTEHDSLSLGMAGHGSGGRKGREATSDLSHDKSGWTQTIGNNKLRLKKRGASSIVGWMGMDCKQDLRQWQVSEICGNSN